MNQQNNYKLIIIKFKKRKAQSTFIDNIWVADLADMQLISKFIKGIHFLLCVINIYRKYAWVPPLKYKKDITIINAFLKIFKESNRKPKKIWVDKGKEFYNSSMKSWLEKNDKEMCSMHNEGKSVVAERFIKTLKNIIYKHMTSTSKNLYNDKINNNNKDPKFKISDSARTVLQKAMFQIGLKKFL